jgi:adenylate kinase family enzyme
MRRRDDDPAVVRARIQEYNAIRNMLLEKYEHLHVVLKVLDATYLTREQVFNWFVEHCIPTSERKEILV